MDLRLPVPLAEFYRATNERDSDAVVECFDPSAVVHDEGEEARGLAAIRTWNDSANERYQTVLEPRALRDDDGRTVVATLVSGTFDGSPVELDFRFVLSAGKIVALDID